MVLLKVYVTLMAMVLLVALGAEASMAREMNAKSTLYPNKCKAAGYNVHMKLNKYYQVPDGCGRMRCDKSYTITYHFCGVVSAEGNFKRVEDPTKPYPGCCPYYVPIE